MQAIKDILARGKNEYVLSWARRVKKSGADPKEILGESFYAIAQQQQHNEKKAHTEALEADHKCLVCEGLGVVRQDSTWIPCVQCEGSGNETCQDADLAPQEIDFKNVLKGLDVHDLKLKAEIIHRVFWYCQWVKKPREDETDRMLKAFFGMVHISKRPDGYFVVCSAQPAWRYEEMIEDKKNNREVKASDEPVPF